MNKKSPKRKVPQGPVKGGSGRPAALPQQRTYSIPDHRLEKPNFTVRQVREGESVSYEISGDLEFTSDSARKPAPAPRLTRWRKTTGSRP